MSLRRELVAEINKLKTSEPIFEITSNNNSWRGPSIVLTCIKPISYHNLHGTTPTAQINPFEYLAQQNFLESFNINTKTFVVDVENIMSHCHSDVRTYCIRLLGKMDTDNEAILKWYDYYALSENRYNTTYIEPMLGLYKYLVSKDETSPDYDKHQQNAIGILELIYQRDFKEDHLPQRRLRRRRR